MECHCGLSIGYMYTRICTYIFIAHIMRHLIKTMCSTCRLKWKSIFTPFCPSSFSVSFCLPSYLNVCIWSLFLVPGSLSTSSHKFIINCFKASRCLSAFCANVGVYPMGHYIILWFSIFISPDP